MHFLSINEYRAHASIAATMNKPTLKPIQVHKGKLIGISFLFAGVGAFVYSLPHFLVSNYTESLLSQNIVNDTSCLDCLTIQKERSLPPSGRGS